MAPSSAPPTDDAQTLRPRVGAPHGNARLTALTGGTLLLLFAVQGSTVLFIGRLITVHIFVGILLIGPVCLKIGSTGYRFLRYHSGASAYVDEGRPAPFLRLLGITVIGASAALLASGLAVAFLGTRWGPLPLLLLHQLVFCGWFAVMSVHVLARIRKLPGLLGADLRLRPARRTAATPGRARRFATLAAVLGAGALIASLCTPLATDWVR